MPFLRMRSTPRREPLAPRDPNDMHKTPRVPRRLSILARLRFFARRCWRPFVHPRPGRVGCPGRSAPYDLASARFAASASTPYLRATAGTYFYGSNRSTSRRCTRDAAISLRHFSGTRRPLPPPPPVLPLSKAVHTSTCTLGPVPVLSLRVRTCDGVGRPIYLWPPLSHVPTCLHSFITVDSRLPRPGRAPSHQQARTPILRQPGLRHDLASVDPLHLPLGGTPVRRGQA